MNQYSCRAAKHCAAVLAWYALVLGAAIAPTPVSAESADRKAAVFFSGTGNLLYLAVGTALPVLEDGRKGKDHALRILDAVTTSVLFSEGLKYSVREKRPDADTRDSFPSGHATAAVALATMESHFHPKQALFWYAGAGLICESRTRLGRHYPHDVIAGAALGYFTGRWALSRRRGLLFSPLIHPDGGVGLLATKAF